MNPRLILEEKNSLKQYIPIHKAISKVKNKFSITSEGDIERVNQIVVMLLSLDEFIPAKKLLDPILEKYFTNIKVKDIGAATDSLLLASYLAGMLAIEFLPEYDLESEIADVTGDSEGLSIENLYSNFLEDKEIVCTMVDNIILGESYDEDAPVSRKISNQLIDNYSMGFMKYLDSYFLAIRFSKEDGGHLARDIEVQMTAILSKLKSTILNF